MSLEEQFYKEVTPEGKNNYVLSGQAKILLMLCKAIDELKAAEQGVQLTGGDSAVFKHLFGVENMPVRKQSPRPPTRR